MKCPHCGSLLYTIIWLPVVECSDCGHRHEKPGHSARLGGSKRGLNRRGWWHPVQVQVVDGLQLGLEFVLDGDEFGRCGTGVTGVNDGLEARNGIDQFGFGVGDFGADFANLPFEGLQFGDNFLLSGHNSVLHSLQVMEGGQFKTGLEPFVLAFDVLRQFTHRATKGLCGLNRVVEQMFFGVVHWLDNACLTAATQHRIAYGLSLPKPNHQTHAKH